jgi:HlyD family secretion protein
MKNLFLLSTVLFLSCSSNSENELFFDGRLETDIIRITVKTAGELDSVLAEEGQTVQKGQLLAIVNSDRLQLQKKQQQAQLQEIAASSLSLQSQIKQINAQLVLNEDLMTKTRNLIDKGAATSQKLDELKMQNDVLNAQKEAVRAQVSALLDKRTQVEVAMELTGLSIKDSRLIAPLNGTILNRYFSVSELVNIGMPLFDLADLTLMEATIYVSLIRLTDIRINQPVEVSADGLDATMNGKIKWIASQAEFTPKTILTEETRTSLVYAVKVSVENTKGILKIGMPVQIKINTEQ